MIPNKTRKQAVAEYIEETHDEFMLRHLENTRFSRTEILKLATCEVDAGADLEAKRLIQALRDEALATSPTKLNSELHSSAMRLAAEWLESKLKKERDQITIHVAEHAREVPEALRSLQSGDYLFTKLTVKDSNSNPEVYKNFSHSGEVVVGAFSDGKPFLYLGGTGFNSIRTSPVVGAEEIDVAELSDRFPEYAMLKDAEVRVLVETENSEYLIEGPLRKAKS